MKTFLISCVVLISLTSGYAQTNPSYSATLRKMFEVSASQEVFKTAVVQMGAIMRQNKEVPEDVWQELEAEILKTSIDQLVEMLSPVYAKHLTEEDLKQMIAFYQSPVGKKFAATNPAIMAESMQVGQVWGQKVGQQIADKLQEKGY